MRLGIVGNSFFNAAFAVSELCAGVFWIVGSRIIAILCVIGFLQQETPSAVLALANNESCFERFIKVRFQKSLQTVRLIIGIDFIFTAAFIRFTRNVFNLHFVGPCIKSVVLYRIGYHLIREFAVQKIIESGSVVFAVELYEVREKVLWYSSFGIFKTCVVSSPRENDAPLISIVFSPMQKEIVSNIIDLKNNLSVEGFELSVINISIIFFLPQFKCREQCGESCALQIITEVYKMNPRETAVIDSKQDNLAQYPLPYKAVNGCLYKEITNKSGITSKKLCNFLPYIVSEVSVDDGAEVKTVLRLGGVHSSGRVLPEIDVTGAELGTFNWLIERWGAGLCSRTGEKR